MSGAPVGVLEQLNKASSAEDFFALLGVDYDAKVVNVVRLHILRRMGQYLVSEDFAGPARRRGDRALQGGARAGLCRFRRVVAARPARVQGPEGRGGAAQATHFRAAHHAEIISPHALPDRISVLLSGRAANGG